MSYRSEMDGLRARQESLEAELKQGVTEKREFEARVEELSATVRRLETMRSLEQARSYSSGAPAPGSSNRDRFWTGLCFGLAIGVVFTLIVALGVGG